MSDHADTLRPAYDGEPDVLKSSEYYRSPRYHIPEALALDFDRTLGDVNAAMARLYATALASGIEVEEIRTAQMQVEQDGGSFDPLTYIKAVLAPEGADAAEYESFCHRFVTAREPVVLFPDAARFLHILQWSDVPHIILTYGVNAAWQRLKAAAAGYSAGMNVMDHTDKGQHIESIRGRDGKFHFFVAMNGDATYTADTMCLVDDKAMAFASLPEDCKGFLVQRGELLASQRGEIPSSVVVINSLDELTVDQAGWVRQRTNEDQTPAEHYRRRWMAYPAEHPFPCLQGGYAKYVPLGSGATIRQQPWHG